MDDTKRAVTALRLRHPDLAFHVDVTRTEYDGRWLAIAMLADEPDIGVGDDPREALRAAIVALGEPYASELAAGRSWSRDHSRRASRSRYAAPVTPCLRWTRGGRRTC